MRTLLVVIIITIASIKCSSTLAADPVQRLNLELEALVNNLDSDSEDFATSDKLSLDPWDTFGVGAGTLTIHKRSLCPNGVGNLGFNSFNFLTFMLMTFNAVASKLCKLLYVARL